MEASEGCPGQLKRRISSCLYNLVIYCCLSCACPFRLAPGRKTQQKSECTQCYIVRMMLLQGSLWTLMNELEDQGHPSVGTDRVQSSRRSSGCLTQPAKGNDRVLRIAGHHHDLSIYGDWLRCLGSTCMMLVRSSPKGFTGRLARRKGCEHHSPAILRTLGSQTSQKERHFSIFFLYLHHFTAIVLHIYFTYILPI